MFSGGWPMAASTGAGLLERGVRAGGPRTWVAEHVPQHPARGACRGPGVHDVVQAEPLDERVAESRDGGGVDEDHARGILADVAVDELDEVAQAARDGTWRAATGTGAGSGAGRGVFRDGLGEAAAAQR